MTQTAENGNLLLGERLAELRREYQLGQEQMAVLDQRRQELRDTLLRISGAIQVLEELLHSPSGAEDAVGLPAAAAGPAQR
jgi:hypothetical protein